MTTPEEWEASEIGMVPLHLACLACGERWMDNLEIDDSGESGESNGGILVRCIGCDARYRLEDDGTRTILE